MVKICKPAKAGCQNKIQYTPTVSMEWKIIKICQSYKTSQNIGKFPVWTAFGNWELVAKLVGKRAEMIMLGSDKDRAILSKHWSR